MATANFTGGEKQQAVAQLHCSADLTAGIHGHLTVLTVLNIFLSISSFLGNSLILAALRKESSLHRPSKLLLGSLATSDLWSVGLIIGPLFVTKYLLVLNEHWSICRFVFLASSIAAPILCRVSLYTLTAISVDRLLALLLGLRYRQVVTLKRTYAIVITFWVVSTFVPTIQFWTPLKIDWWIVIDPSLCVVISIFSYTKIFLTLRHRQNQIQDQARQPNQANQLNIARYRKAVSTTLWLQLTLLVCYLPFVITRAFSLTHNGLPTSIFLVGHYTVTLVFFNSILYCWKIDEVRQAVKDTIRQVLCCLSS